ncbi:response regulator [Streptomyces sp. NPDC050388]|uniref:response regulator n=1 Tax=Streptomyces sp. NPDC050388 TaxID=3155781 RepID=UPI00342438A7
MPRDHRPATSVRVLLAEDPVTRYGALAFLLRMEPGIEVVAQVAAGRSVVETALTHRPDVALLDLGPAGPSGPNGLDTAAALRDQVPDCRVLILTTAGGPEPLRRALAAGAAGFLVKDGSVRELASAIRRVLAGETVIDPALAAVAAADTAATTDTSVPPPALTAHGSAPGLPSCVPLEQGRPEEVLPEER